MSVHLLEPALRWPPETFVMWRLEGMVARGFRVTVLTHSRPPYQAPPGIDVVYYPLWEAPWRRQIESVLRHGIVLTFTHPRRWRLLWRAARERTSHKRGLVRARRMVKVLAGYLPLVRQSPDVIHFEWMTALAHFVPVVEGPVVASCHGSELNIHLYNPARESYIARFPLAIERADVVHCVSHELAEKAKAHGVAPEKPVVIHNSVDTAFFSPNGSLPRGEHLRILGVGWLRWVKGWEYALMTVRRLIDAGVPAHFEIVGADPPGELNEESERERIEETIADLDLSGHVTMLGWLSSEAIRERMRRSDVFFHASLSEGLATVMLEAMACGLPVVMTDSGGMHEAIENGVEGIIVPVRDTDAMAEALAGLWRDPERAAAIGAAARRRVEADFSLEPMLDRFASVYEGLASR